MIKILFVAATMMSYINSEFDFFLCLSYHSNFNNSIVRKKGIVIKKKDIRVFYHSNVFARSELYLVRWTSGTT